MGYIPRRWGRRTERKQGRNRCPTNTQTYRNHYQKPGKSLTASEQRQSIATPQIAALRNGIA